MRGYRHAHPSAESEQIGGSRAMALTSDHHAARLVFQSASVLIAEYLRG